MKSGILEIADIFVVNKADRPGAEEMQTAIERMLDRKEQVTKKFQWRPPVLRTSADRGDGISMLYENIVRHHKYLKDSDVLTQRRELQFKSDLIRGVHREVMDILKASGIDDDFFLDLARTMKKRNKLPHSAAKALAQKIFGSVPKGFENKNNLLESLLSNPSDDQKK